MNNSSEIASLEKFLIDNDDFEKLETKLSGFNIFESIGAVRQELRHSEFLSFLLNPSENHGLGESILKSTLIDVIANNDFNTITALEIELSSFDNVEVRREWRNIDILIIHEDLKTVLAIENKVDSSESRYQLKTYSQTLNEVFGDSYRILKVFLTPDGIPPQYDESWGIYSYQKFASQIESFLKKKSDELSPKITLMLNDYLILLRRHVVPDQQLVELCRKIYREHSKALDLIFDYKMDIYTDIQSHLIELIEKDENVELDDSNKTYIRFRPKSFDEIEQLNNGEGWTSTKKVLLFEIESRKDSLRLKLVIGPAPSHATRESIFEAAQSNKKIFKNGTGKLTGKWATIYKHDILSKSYYDNLDFESMQKKMNSFWENFTQNDLKQIESIVLESQKR